MPDAAVGVLARYLVEGYLILTFGRLWEKKSLNTPLLHAQNPRATR